MATQTATGVISFGGNYYGLGIKDANSNYALAHTPFYQTSAGILIPAPMNDASIPQVATGGSGSLDGGTLSATTAAAALGSSQACSEVLIQADPSNTDNVLIGGSTSQTIVLSPGASETVPASNVDLIYAKSASGSQTVNYMWRS